MLQLTRYLENVAVIESDLGTIQTATVDVGDALDAVEAFLGVPATISSALNSASGALSIPTSVINVLKNLPFGIGTAVKAFDSAAKGLKASISTSKTTMDQINTKLNPVRDAVEDGKEAISLANTTVTLAATAFIVAEDEAARLEASFGDQPFYPGGGSFRLPSRIDGFNEAVDEYVALRNEVLNGISEVAALAETAADALADAMPDTSVATGLKRALEKVFDPISNLLKDVEDALDGIKLFGFSALDVLNAISDFAEFIVDGITELVNIALDAIGLSLGSIDDAINDLLADLLSPFNPIQQAINDLNSKFNSLLADLTDPLNEAVADLAEMTRELRDAVDLGLLFENSVVGDENPVRPFFGDELSGTEGEIDGIYGLRGRDELLGGKDDFVFGGNGGDTIIAQGSRVEAYGGAGRDRIRVDEEIESASLRADGGEGNDIMIGGKQSDTFFGNLGNDIMIGKGGTDVFYFTGDLGDDRVFGGEEIYNDAHFIDAALVGDSVPSLAELEQNYATVGNNSIRLDFDNGSSVTFYGVTDLERLYNTFIADGGFFPDDMV
ncbi:calcium-binding protein [Dinoroseobacter sp. S76]|uniref:calcium-binding protein n=1 Tax=Dinoroseobacter sp. S76 TaxID=3415124 RepID=UPI003C7CDAB2